MTKTNNFIKKSKLLHNEKYDYSLTEYIKSSEKVSIICKEHGDFLQTPNTTLLKNNRKEMPKHLNYTFYY
jgi:hypothetical protein